MRQLLFVLIVSSITSASAQNRARTPNVYAPSACADVALPRRADSLDKLVIARMHGERIPAVQLSVLRHGRIETRVHGYADLDHCVPANSNTIFGIGSVSKQLTAYAALRFVGMVESTNHPPESGGGGRDLRRHAHARVVSCADSDAGAAIPDSSRPPPTSPDFRRN